VRHLRWRLNDPIEENDKRTGARWTRVHKFVDGDSHTLCGLAIPDHPYMADYDDGTPDGAPVCDRCKTVARRGA
jgi:hypothetical protein